MLLSASPISPSYAEEVAPTPAKSGETGAPTASPDPQETPVAVEAVEPVLSLDAYPARIDLDDPKGVTGQAVGGSDLSMTVSASGQSGLSLGPTDWDGDGRFLFRLERDTLLRFAGMQITLTVEMDADGRTLRDAARTVCGEAEAAGTEAPTGTPTAAPGNTPAPTDTPTAGPSDAPAPSDTQTPTPSDTPTPTSNDTPTPRPAIRQRPRPAILHPPRSTIRRR